jgi:hypothetical protein
METTTTRPEVSEDTNEQTAQAAVQATEVAAEKAKTPNTSKVLKESLSSLTEKDFNKAIKALPEDVQALLKADRRKQAEKLAKAEDKAKAKAERNDMPDESTFSTEFSAMLELVRQISATKDGANERLKGKFFRGSVGITKLGLGAALGYGLAMRTPDGKVAHLQNLRFAWVQGSPLDVQHYGELPPDVKDLRAAKAQQRINALQDFAAGTEFWNAAGTVLWVRITDRNGANANQVKVKADSRAWFNVETREAQNATEAAKLAKEATQVEHKLSQALASRDAEAELRALVA